MKKVLSALLAAAISFFVFSYAATALTVTQEHITTARTVTESPTLKFAKKFGANYKNAPTPPIIAENTLIVASGTTLYKLDLYTGEEISHTQMQGSNFYATVSPLYADGKIFVQLDGGCVQAFDFETLSPLWIYRDTLGGQALCPLTYDGKYIYTGFWNGEDDYADYVCLNADCLSETNSALWTYKSLGGFYWAGCAVTDDYVIFGKDDGNRGSTGKSEIIAVNKTTGKKTSSLAVTGDIRSAITYFQGTDSFYTSSKAGFVYKFSLNRTNGKLGSLKTYTASGAVTATPVIYKNRLYVGSQNGTAGKFNVIDASSMQLIYSADMSAYPQAAVLVGNGYEPSTEKIYIYITYNGKPGGITVFEDSAKQTTAVGYELFVPDGQTAEYCISSVTADIDGTLYYKNDSGYIFAISKTVDYLSILRNIFDLLQNIFAVIWGAITP